MKLGAAVALALALQVHAQVRDGQPVAQPGVTLEVHLKALKLIEESGARARIASSIPDLLEQAKAATQKQCPDCTPAFFAEWGKRMAARLKVDDFISVAARAYEKRFTDDELTELLAFVSSQQTNKPVPLSPALQKKLTDVLPAILGETVGGCTEIGARLGGEIGAEIEKEHPEYCPKKPNSGRS